MILEVNLQQVDKHKNIDEGEGEGVKDNRSFICDAFHDNGHLI